MRSGAMIAGAAPAHSGVNRTATACADSTGATVHLLLSPAPQLLRSGAVDLDHALVSGSSDDFGARDGDGAAGDLQDVAGPGADAREVGRREPRDGVPDVLDARFRDAQA